MFNSDILTLFTYLPIFIHKTTCPNSDDKDKMIAKMKEFNIDNTLVICNEENTKYFNNAISYGKNLQDIAHNIFKILREVDKYNKDLVIIEGVTKDGLGLAIMNRLIRSCSHNYIEL